MAFLFDSSHYAHLLPDEGPPADDVLRRRHSTLVLRIAERLGPLRGLLVFRAARDYDGVVTISESPGELTLTLLEGFVRRRRGVVVLQLIAHPLSGVPWRRAVRRLQRKLVRGPALRRGMRTGQVLTDWEVDHFVREYRLDPERIVYVPWPWRMEPGDDEPDVARDNRRVVSSGYAYCDWPTLFAAAANRDWDLTVVCGEHERELVESLNRDGRAEVLVNLPREEHVDLVRRSSVYVLCVRDVGASTGHGRLMHANEVATPVVATEVRGLAGYLVPGETAMLVPPGDHERLGETVDALLGDAGLRARLAAAAYRRSGQWPYAAHTDAIRRILHGERPSVP